MKPITVLTPIQKSILSVIYTYVKRHGMPPTRQEIREAMGFHSPNAVTYQIKALVKKGALDWTPHISRGIRPKNKVKARS